jgi:CRISPR-associated Cas5-like protein
VSNALAAVAAVHAVLARALILFALVLALWGSYQFFRYRAVSGGFRSSFLMMAGLTAVQGLLGVVTLAAGHRPREGWLHIVYGIFAVIFLPGVFTYARGAKDREALFLAASCWIVLIAYGRGFMTG